MLTETQIRTARMGELVDLRNRIEAELARRDLAKKEPAVGNAVKRSQGNGECVIDVGWLRFTALRPPAPDRQVVGEKPHSAGTLRLEMVKCGKDRCRKCAKGPAHGPYWYLYFRRNEKLTSKYIGKTEDPEGDLEKKLG